MITLIYIDPQLWNAHLPLSQYKVKPASAGGEDAAVEKTLATMIKLYRYCTNHCKQNTLHYMSRVMTKPVFRVFDQV